MCNPTIVVRYREMSVLVRLTVGDRTVPSLTATVSRRVEVRGRQAGGLGRLLLLLGGMQCGVLPSLPTA